MAPFSNPEEKQRPLMLKDFLWDDSLQRLSCCEISQQSASTIKFLLEVESKSHSKRTEKNPSDRAPSRIGLSRSRSRTALNKASEAVINVVKLLPFAPKVPSPCDPTKKRPKHRALSSILKRLASAKDLSAHQSLSRRFTTAMRSLSGNKKEEQCEIRVRVRDIIRWKSFGDVDISHEQENCNSPQRSKISDETLDFSSSSSSSRSSSGTWSHCASNLQSSSGGSECSDENDPEEPKTKKKLLQGSSPNFHCPVSEKSMAVEGEVLETLELDSVETATCYGEPGAECQLAECLLEEKEQFSPVSVLDFSYEDEETTTFEQSLANMERTKQQLLRKILRFESLVELDPLNLAEELEFSGEDLDQYSDGSRGDEDINDIAMGYSICQEESASEERAGDLYKLLKTGFDGQGLMGSQGEVNKEACINEMEKDGKWRNLKEEHEEMALEMEAGVLGLLVNELLLDLLDNASSQTTLKI